MLYQYNLRRYSVFVYATYCNWTYWTFRSIHVVTQFFTTMLYYIRMQHCFEANTEFKHKVYFGPHLNATENTIAFLPSKTQ